MSEGGYSGADCEGDSAGGGSGDPVSKGRSRSGRGRPRGGVDSTDSSLGWSSREL